MRIVNSPMYIVYEPSLKSYYLKIGDEWFTSGKAKGHRARSTFSALRITAA